MKKQIQDNKCKTVRGWIFSVLSKRIGLDADWVQKHIATCPKCQKRLAWTSKVNLAISLVKTEPHDLGLLAKANQKTIATLKHGLRYNPKAEPLKTAAPKPSFFEKMRKYSTSAANIAACFTIVLLLKSGVFNSVEKFQQDSQHALKHYYASQVGDDIADDIFEA